MTFLAPPLLAALGRATTDFFGAGLRLAELQSSNELGEVSVQVGGAGAIAAVAAAAMGCDVRFCGKIADDFLGRFIVEGLRSAGIDTSLMVTGTGRLSPFSFTAIGRDGESCAFTTAGDVLPMQVEEIETELILDGIHALLLDGADPVTQAVVAEAASARDIPVILDVGDLREGTGELVALADVLISSERLASEIAPRGELQDSLIELQQLGPRSVIITMGEAGSIGLHDDQLVQQPPFAVRVLSDTSGAGHVYHGAFAAALLHGDEFARCMEFASAAAGLSCAEIGALAGIPERSEVLSQLD